MSSNNVPWISSISFGVVQDTGVQRDLEMYSQGNFDYTISDKKLNLAKCIIPISYMYRYGFFSVNKFFLYNQVSIYCKTNNAKKRHIRNLASFKSKVKKNAFPKFCLKLSLSIVLLYVVKGDGFGEGAKNEKKTLIWIRSLTNILTIPHRYEQSIKDDLKQCNDFLLYFQFGVNLINHSSVDIVSASMKR